MTIDEELKVIELEVAEIHAVAEAGRLRLLELVARRDELLFASGQASLTAPTGGNVVNVPTAKIIYKARI